MSDQLLDNELQLNSVTQEIHWAGFWIRVGASILDVLVTLPLIALNIYNLSSLKNLPLELITTIILIAYKPWMEYQYGATVGKMAVNIRVVNKEYNRISPAQSLIRFSPWLIGYIISIFGTILLFQNPQFYNITNWIDIGNLQNELLPKATNFIGSIILIISCIVVAFSEAKQGLHDMLAGTYCIYK